MALASRGGVQCYFGRVQHLVSMTEYKPYKVRIPEADREYLERLRYIFGCYRILRGLLHIEEVINIRAEPFPALKHGQ
jgi:hypothetical protein